jgi:glutamate/tyrosine decarboxylase-like PLP-dependent enzyme
MTVQKPRYRELLDALRRQFPQPVSDPVHDAYVVDSVRQALDRVDALKGQTPMLGLPRDPDFAAAGQAQISETPQTLEQVIAELVGRMEGMFVWGHPKSQLNVIPPPSIASLIGVLLASAYNPNLCSEESGRGFSAVEVQAAAMAARLVGYDPGQSAGLFTFGGTGCMLYAIKVGLEKAQPGCLQEGVRPGAVVLASRAGHYSALNVAAWLGLGQRHVLLAPCNDDDSVCVEALAQTARRVLSEGRPIAAIVATLGSTDAFGLDDLQALDALREELVREFSLGYRPHLHADAVIGWAWAAFNDYDFERNELGFRRRTLCALATAHERIRQLPLADSIGIDFHKTGYAPYISSLVLFRDRRDLDLIRRSRETAPYLYQSGEHHPGTYTLETSRGGAGPMAALANLLQFGKQGLRTLLGHAVEMAEILRDELQGCGELAVLNGGNVGGVTLFRVYPSGADAAAVLAREYGDASYQSQVAVHNRLNRLVFERLHADALAGRGVLLSMTDCYRPTEHGSPLAAIKSYVLSPFSDETEMRSVLSSVLAARDVVLKGPSFSLDRPFNSGCETRTSTSDRS